MPQFLPLKPCGQSQPQLEFGTPSFKHRVGKQGSYDELDEHPE